MAKLKSSAKSRAGASPAARPELGRSIMDSAQQIWLAGMGAFARAQEEGTRLFETLVREGMNVERQTRKAAGGRVDAVRQSVEEGVGQVRERAADTWDRLEKVFEDRVQRALNRLGVPGRDEIQSLSRRVDELTREVRKLDTTPAPRKAPVKRAPATPVSPAKRSARKAPAKTSAG